MRVGGGGEVRRCRLDNPQGQQWVQKTQKCGEKVENEEGKRNEMKTNKDNAPPYTRMLKNGHQKEPQIISTSHMSADESWRAV